MYLLRVGYGLSIEGVFEKCKFRYFELFPVLVDTFICLIFSIERNVLSIFDSMPMLTTM